jgi:hypothetical protein
MSINHSAIVELKNNWLYQQVDVEYPTQESLIGRAIYQQHQTERRCEPWSPIASPEGNHGDVYLADFHRLTIAFALLQADQYLDESDKSHIIEFLTQIMYSEPCELYLGFEKGRAVACAIITRSSGQVLVSDIVVKNGSQFVDAEGFASLLIDKLTIDTDSYQCYIQY